MADAFDFKKACDYVEDLARLGSRPGMKRIEGLCAILGDPQEDLRFIHIAGTNGKGSTASFISSILTCAGVKTGMYYSPALTGISDHYMINGQKVSDEAYARCVSTVAAANEKLIEMTGESATQFEFETAVAFTLFKEDHCDAVILECGMGGRDDATNIVGNKICCVFASISRDHMQYLGDTLGQIAQIKSGIITSDCPVISFSGPSEAVSEIKKRCDETGSTLYLVDPKSFDIPKEDIGLRGSYQTDNAALALKVISVIKDNDLMKGAVLDDETVREGLRHTRWPFRFEKICDSPIVIVDGAHNEDAAKRLAESVRSEYPNFRIVLVLAVFADKEYEKIASILAPLADVVIATKTPDNPRALSAEDLAACVRDINLNVRVCETIKDACDMSFDEADAIREKIAGGADVAILACGSLSYLNMFRNEVIGRKNGSDR